MAANATRLYKVTTGENVYAVEAKTQAVALSTVFKRTSKVETLSAIEAVTLVQSGVEVLRAEEEPAE